MSHTPDFPRKLLRGLPFRNAAADHDLADDWPSGTTSMLIDTEDYERAALRAQLLAAIVASSDDAIVSKDLNGVIQSWNAGAERLFGYAPDEAVGKSITIIIPSDRLDEETTILSRIRAGERIDHFDTVRQRKNGTMVHVSLSVSPVVDTTGRIVGASKIARDITERRRAHEQQELLLREMNHRIKNSLAIVQAIASQTLRSVKNEERDAFMGRLQSLARAHDLLSESTWDSAGLCDVVIAALEPFREKLGERIAVDGPRDTALDARKAVLIAMALHELATNAAKYGALSNETGRVSVAWSRERSEADSPVRLEWRESGGPPVMPPSREGFGSRMIARALADIGEVSFEFPPDGVQCTLVFTV